MVSALLIRLTFFFHTQIPASSPALTQIRLHTLPDWGRGRAAVGLKPYFIGSVFFFFVCFWVSREELTQNGHNSWPILSISFSDMCLSYRSIAEQYACSADSIQGAAHLLSFSGQSKFVQCKLRVCSKETKCYRRSGELLLHQFACFWTNPFICIVLLPQRSQEVERKVSCVWFCSATDGWKGHVGFDLCWRAALDRCGRKYEGTNASLGVIWDLGCWNGNRGRSMS